VLVLNALVCPNPYIIAIALAVALVLVTTTPFIYYYTPIATVAKTSKSKNNSRGGRVS